MPAAAPRLTRFTSPRSFAEARFARRQCNAMLALRPTPGVLRFGAEAGVADAARELGVTHVHDVEGDERGVPMQRLSEARIQGGRGHDMTCRDVRDS